ncbi:putative thiamine diphosphate-binding protein [Seiridium cardinale]|uniref:Thiamine diphosphate-binding protein n=1 Tax=Seiridium cardinale TaxID=138064 RepID=A0ABR2XK00_9PEZI
MAQVLVGDYLFRRLREIGITPVFGVPGDYELELLDLIPSNNLSWIGSLNELVAAHYVNMSAEVSFATAILNEASTAAQEIDSIECSQPGYIGIPQEIAFSRMEPSSLATPIQRFLCTDANNTEVEVVSKILARLREATRPVLVIDGGGAPQS